MSKQILEQIRQSRIIAIVRGIPVTQMIDLIGAMERGGIRCVEVTFDQSSATGEADTCAAISAICAHFGDRICVGAGTVMTVQQVQLAAQAGAQYMISPNVDEAVIRETKRLDRISIPGAFTPTETAAAYQYGADIVKLFPAGILGTAYIKALKAPLSHIPVMAVGGVTPENCAQFIQAGAIGVGVGGNLVSPQLVQQGRFDEITAIARQYVQALDS